jgi:NAD(P)-dependent dehydrogenase (short-subunit alcohol dehydrogenase family)
MSHLEGTVTLITGGGGALAAPIASAFAARGGRVALLDVVAPEARAHEWGGLAVGVDVMDAEATRRAVESVRAWGGRLDHVIHTIGGFTWGPAWEAQPGDFDKMFDLNVRSLFHVGRASLPLLREQGRGLLAGVASGQAWKGGTGGVALYAASKAAVAAWLRSVDEELEGTDVKVSVLFPMGVIDTPANRRAMPEARPEGWIDPVDLAEALVFSASTSRRGRARELPIYPGRE